MKTIVFTGFRDDELKRQIESKGWRVVPRVTSETDVLVTSGVKGATSSAVKTADRLKTVDVLDRTEFEKTYFPPKFSLFSWITGKDDVKSKTQGKGETCHKTLHMGGNPYKVCYDSTSKSFWVWRGDFMSHDDTYRYTKLAVKPTAYKKVFVGNDAIDPTVIKFRGNSVLFELSSRGTKTSYMFVGAEIVTFSLTNDKILSLRSPVGNSRVPYPHALSRKNTYLMRDDGDSKTYRYFIPTKDVLVDEDDPRNPFSPYETFRGLSRHAKGDLKSHRILCQVQG
jgi:hypothetical protein